MSVRTRLWIIALVAALHSAFFIAYQAPDWDTVADQDGYRRLARALADTGRFTRFPASDTFVPEVIRTPGYPLVVALIYKVAGTSQVAVATVQAVLFVALTLMVFAMARAVWPSPVPVLAAAATALYPTFPYFGALVMTELWTTFVLTLSMFWALRAQHTGARRDLVITGFLLGYTALSRPAFVLLPFAIVGMGVLIFGRSRDQMRRVVRPWAWTLAAFAVTLLPWFIFNGHVMGRYALAPAGGVGRGLWEGSWHGRWPGRLQNELTQLAAEASGTPTLETRVRELARQHDADAALMLTYVHQWRDIRRIWDTPVDPHARADARIAADAEYRRVALANISGDVVGYLWRRLTHGLFVLWNADIWLRYSAINAAPPLLIRAMWGIQAVLALLAAWGAWALVRQRLFVAGWLLITPLLYVTAVHVPLLTEARQSLPVKPLLLIAATIGAWDLRQKLWPTSPRTAAS